MDADQRATFLIEACGDDAQLRRAVDQILLMQESATIASNDSERSPSMNRAVRPPGSPCIEPDQQVDDFRVIRQLGEGAMGVVYLAEQQNPKRRVALKLLRTDTMSPTRERRFEFETESLAKLHHPGIATIYKSGRADVDGVKRPFFAMELVDGQPLDVFTASLDMRRRVEMIAGICDAIEHAHRRGVLHRDLKPANIVVGRDQRARVLDFGVATSTDPEHRTSELVGTLPYMSPEQLRSEPDVDGRADVYALGVILCETLTGGRPHDLMGLMIDAACDRVLEPPTIDAADIDRELEMIIRKAIAPDRSDRYSSAFDLGEDLRRYLTNRPVEAVQGGRGYRTKKFISRHRTPVLLAGLAGVIAIGGVIGISYQAARATQGWHQAELETEQKTEALNEALAQHRRAMSVNRFMIDMLISGDPEQTLGEELTVVEMLDTASGTLENELADFPETAAGVRMALANTYRSLGRLEDARYHAERMVEECVRDLGEQHTMTSDALRTLALILFDFGAYAEAEALLDRATPAVQALNDPIESAKMMGEYARVAHGSGDHTKSFELWSDAERVLTGTLGPMHKETLITMNNRGMALKDLGRLEESEQVLRTVYERRLEGFGADHPQTLVGHDVLAGVIQKQGRDAEAAGMLREVVERRSRVLGVDHVSTLVSMGNLGATLIRLGELDEAERLTRASLGGHVKRFGEGHAKSLILLGNLAYVLEDRGRLEEAASMYRRAIDIRRRSSGGADPETWSTMNNLAMLLMSIGKPEEAEPLFDELLAMCDAALPPGHYYTALFRNNHAECLTMLGKYDGARDALDRSHPVIARTFGEGHARTLKSLGRIERLDELVGVD